MKGKSLFSSHGSKLFAVWVLQWAIGVSWFAGLSLNQVKAHQVEQFYVTVDEANERLVVNFDVGYAISNTRDDPNEPQPTREWLNRIADIEHIALREEAEVYLRRGISFEKDGVEIPYAVRFVDFDRTPYSFLKLLNRGAYYRVAIEPERWTGGLSLVVNDTDFPKLALKFDGVSGVRSVGAGEKVLLSAVDVSGWSFLMLGFRHVIPEGWDHVLFILGLCLMASVLRNLLWQSAVFTIAHSVSLGLVVSGFLTLGGVAQWVEPMIALSIILIGIEGFYERKNRWWRYGMVAVFGVVHGLGFAGSLGSALQSMDNEHWLMPLLVANVGIELAQIILLIVGCATLWFLAKKLDRGREIILRKLFATGVAFVGVVWLVQRLA